MSKTMDKAVARAKVEAVNALWPYCKHTDRCAAFPATSEQQIELTCNCGLIELVLNLEGHSAWAQNLRARRQIAAHGKAN